MVLMNLFAGKEKRHRHTQNRLADIERGQRGRDEVRE